jgi:hypothetical protein
MLHIPRRWKAIGNFLWNNITKFLEEWNQRRGISVGSFSSLTTIAKPSPFSNNDFSTLDLVIKLVPSPKEGLGT